MTGRTVSHYEIVRKLGEGGMGVVYLARDLRLDRLVALKFLAHHLLALPAARTRFLREAKAISALNHPNIATIYDVEQTGEETFLALEYLPGGTLRSLVEGLAAAGRTLLTEQVLEYGIRIGEGLAHAHRNGIWHRDVKTANVLLSEEGIVKITDFGLAKFGSGAGVTPSGFVLGTAAYMAPEQAEGKQVDHRSDIFSFGVVLYELAAGELPFRGESDSAVLYQIVHKDAPPLAERRPDLPESFVQIVARAMEKDPERRYQQMEDALADLKALGRPTSSTVTIYKPPAATRPHTRRWLLTAAALALCFVAALWLWWKSSRPVLGAGSSVLLAEVDNQTGDRQLDAVTELLRSQLGQSAYFNLLEAARVREILDRMVRPPGQVLDRATAREVAWRGGVPLVISGNLASLGSGFVLNLSLDRIGNQPNAPEAVWSKTFQAAAKNGLFDAIHESSNWIRSISGEASQDMAERDRPVEETTTSSWEALGFFSLAEKKVVENRYDDALLLFRESVRVDPQFALAYMRLGDLSVMLRRYEEGYSYWRKAIEHSGSRRLTKREELRIQSMYADDTADYLKAEQLYRAFALQYPNDPNPLRGLATVLKQLGRYEEALDKLQEAARKWPDIFQVPAHMARIYLAQARLTDAQAQIQRVRALSQDQWANMLDGNLAFLKGDYAGAQRLFQSLTEAHNPYWSSGSFLMQACLLAELGKYAEATQLLKDGIVYDSQTGHTAERADKLLALAYLHYRKGERTAARIASLSAASLEGSPNRALRAGSLLARAGFAADAQALLTRLPREDQAPIFRLARHRIQGEILLSQGAADRALAEFRAADALEAPRNHRTYLARALVAAGDARAAIPLYQRLAAAPAVLWQMPEVDDPGLWSDVLFQYARLAAASGDRGPARAAFARYLDVRRYADPDLAEVAQARMELRQLQ